MAAFAGVEWYTGSGGDLALLLMPTFWASQGSFADTGGTNRCGRDRGGLLFIQFQRLQRIWIPDRDNLIRFAFIDHGHGNRHVAVGKLLHVFKRARIGRNIISRERNTLFRKLCFELFAKSTGRRGVNFDGRHKKTIKVLQFQTFQARVFFFEQVDGVVS